MPINFKHITFKQALVYAKAEAGMTKEEISEASGINMSQISRYFQENDFYAPSPALIPLLCRVLGNTILAEWLNAQVAEIRTPIKSIVSVDDLTIAVMRATKNTGDLNSRTLEAIADGDLSVSEAQLLQAQFRQNGLWNLHAAEALEPLASGKISAASK